jgi:3-hydroxyisobutyrate dehydrogenase-like beta-hydroxyacid dehydrogenase
VYDGPRGLMASMKPGSTVIEMSTILPETSRTLNQLGKSRGVEVLDVAISGSTPAAERGALTLLGGGDERVFESCKPIFEVLARHYFYLGPSGPGTTMKLVVNTLLGVNMQTIAEAVAFGEKAGLDRRLLFEVLAQTAVVAPAHQGKLPRAEHRDYSPQFPLRLMNKDFRLILDKAARLPFPNSYTHSDSCY